MQLVIVDTVDEHSCEYVWWAGLCSDIRRESFKDEARVFGKAGLKLMVSALDLDAVFCRFSAKYSMLGEEYSLQIEQDCCKLEFILQAIQVF